MATMHTADPIRLVPFIHRTKVSSKSKILYEFHALFTPSTLSLNSYSHNSFGFSSNSFSFHDHHFMALHSDTRYQSNLNEIGLSEQKSFLDKTQNPMVANGIASGEDAESSGGQNPSVAIAWLLITMPTLLLTIRTAVGSSSRLSLC